MQYFSNHSKIFPFSPRKAEEKIIPRITQSRHIAQAIPNTPCLNAIPNSSENTNRTPTIVKMEMTVVNPTSPVARNPVPNGSAKGKAVALNML